MENLTFKPLTEEHVEWARLLHNDPDVLRMLTDPHEVTEEEQKGWFERLQQTTKSLRWVVFVDEAPIGLIRIDQVDKYNSSVCIGLDIHKDFRGKGYAKPIYRKLINEWINRGFNRIWLMVADYNTAAKNLYTSLGFVLEGRQREALYRDGKLHEYLMMSLLKSDLKSGYDPMGDP